MQRLQRLAGHVVASAPELVAQPTAGISGATPGDDDVVICCALRSAVGKAGKGFKEMPPEDLLAEVFKAVIERTKIDPKEIGDCVIGNALQPGAGGFGTRMSMFLAGLPYEVPMYTINRQCSSGLQSVATVAQSIKAGTIDVGLAGGVESMSTYPMACAYDQKKLSPNIMKNAMAKACILSMGITSENVAEKYNISRETQDKFAEASHEKALKAQKEGLFDSEIIPIKTTQTDKDGNKKEVVISKDEGPRPGTTFEVLSKMKPAFKEGGSTTAGNASQLSDGAALVLLARRSKAKELGLPILARFRSFAAVGVDPHVMGIGPAYAIPPALKQAGLSVGDVDIFEINEAFASQAFMSINHLKIPMEKVNPKGGAIALGHPLGCTGSRQIASLLPELKRQGKKIGVVSMCIGSGMGAAGVIESEQ
ncbi:Acaa1b [Symbiodinium pilosum]|uniref:acetyl-CoA C-acyltransferase n=1 Tax=Symbiodinium pilosum TaxID=2952 RepID=A0A812KL21_SYMPI|nr:Acaa1b [Symbiodinium pilosum]